jgi:hypothetical protein
MAVYMILHNLFVSCGRWSKDFQARGAKKIDLGKIARKVLQKTDRTRGSQAGPRTSDRP